MKSWWKKRALFHQLFNSFILCFDKFSPFFTYIFLCSLHYICWFCFKIFYNQFYYASFTNYQPIVHRTIEKKSAFLHWKKSLELWVPNRENSISYELSLNYFLNDRQYLYSWKRLHISRKWNLVNFNPRNFWSFPSDK